MIQIKTIRSKNKPKIFFFKFEKENQFKHVLKGPLNSRTILDQLISDKIKTLLLNDEYKSSVMNRNGELFYLSENFIPIDESKTLITSANCEKNQIIYSGNRFLLSNPSILSEHCQLKLLKVLLVRKFIGAINTTNQNIIVINDNVYSINDPFSSKTSNFIFQNRLNCGQKETYQKIWKRFEKEIELFLTESKEKIQNSELSQRLKDFIIERIDSKNEWNF